MPLNSAFYKTKVNDANNFNEMEMTEREAISNNSNGRHAAIKEHNHMSDGRVQWTVKSLMDPNNSKGFSNFNSWLSSQKRNNDGRQLVTSSQNGNVYSTSGFDLTKLYPELSSKLGLTNSQSADSVKNCQNIKRYNNCIANGTELSTSINDVESSVKKVIPNPVNKNQKVQKITTNNLIRPPRKKVPVQLIETSNVTIEDNAKYKSIRSIDNLSVLVKRKQKNIQHKLASSKVQSVGTTYPPASGSTHKPTVINFLPRRPTTLPQEEGLTSSQLRVQSMYQKHYAYTSDLFPLGFENLDTEPNDTNLVSSSLLSSNLLVNGDTFDDPSTSYKHSSLHSCFRRQLLTVKDGIKLQNDGLNHQLQLSRELINATRLNPTFSASVVEHFTRNPSHSNCKKLEKKYRSTLLTRRGCVYELSEGTACQQKALPGTRHCVRHITYNVDQQLFSQCSVKSEENILCRIPTFDVQHDHPVCGRHMDYAEGLPPDIQPAADVKRPRKKNKMPILCRYGKRNKKRRRTSANLGVVPSTSVRPPINSPAVCLGSPQPASPFSPGTSPTFSNRAESGKADDSDFEEELEVMDGGLALDDAASGLLDKDLKDVLNNFGDNELSHIFYGPEPKSETDEKGIAGVSAETNRNVQEIVTTCEPTEVMTLDANTLVELSGNGCIDSIISSSFNQQELNTISQVLSNMVQDETLNLASFQLTSNPVGFNGQPKCESVPVDASDDFVKKELEGDSVLPPIDTGVPCKLSLVKQTNKLQVDSLTLSPLQ